MGWLVSCAGLRLYCVNPSIKLIKYIMQGLFNTLLLSYLFILPGLLLVIQVHHNKSFKLYGFVEFSLSPYIMFCICFQVVVIRMKIISLFLGNFTLILELLMLVWVWMVNRVQGVGGWNERQQSWGCSRVRTWISSTFLDCFHPPCAARARICSCLVSPTGSSTHSTSFWIRVIVLK